MCVFVCLYVRLFIVDFGCFFVVDTRCIWIFCLAAMLERCAVVVVIVALLFIMDRIFVFDQVAKLSLVFFCRILVLGFWFGLCVDFCKFLFGFEFECKIVK